MATRPLDAAFGGSTTKKSKKRGAILAVGIVAGLASIGSIFAATVSINTDNAEIQFSQGTTTIAACDTQIDASLGAFFNESFQLDTITLTDVAAACDGKTLTLELYDGGTKLATVVGGINVNGSTQITIGTADQALADVSVSGVIPADALQDADVTYHGDPSETATTLAANADRIVIEIN